MTDISTYEHLAKWIEQLKTKMEGVTELLSQIERHPHRHTAYADNTIRNILFPLNGFLK